MPTSQFLKQILNVFPKGYSLAFAYGSSVFKQAGYQSKNKMIDFIFILKNPSEWHRENLQMNPSHYSFLKYGGPNYISKFQDNFGARVYFNTLVNTKFGLIKYGLITVDSLISDLLDWETLYISGRLHKPVCILHNDNCPMLNRALKLNLYSALHSALLLLPESFSEKQLYTTIAGISYCGDFRMHVGEDKQKVNNIVDRQILEFRKVYQPLLINMKEHCFFDFNIGQGEQDLSPAARLYHFSMLPKYLQLELRKEWNKDGQPRDLEDVLRAAANDPDSSDFVVRGMTNIVKASSLTQSSKTILTAGLLKSVKYSTAKLNKMWNSEIR